MDKHSIYWMCTFDGSHLSKFIYILVSVHFDHISAVFYFVQGLSTDEISISLVLIGIEVKTPRELIFKLKSSYKYLNYKNIRLIIIVNTSSNRIYN